MAAKSNDKLEKVNEIGTGMRLTLNMIRTRFPEVPQMQTKELDDLINSENPNSRKLVLLDVRTKEEFEISHIAKALWIHPNTKNMADLLALIQAQVADPDDLKIVVAYCSVGYRSCSLLQDLMCELQKPEYTKHRNSTTLYNLEGSIFQWANENRPVVDCDNSITLGVHPYNFVWGKLLNSEFRRTSLNQEGKL